MTKNIVTLWPSDAKIEIDAEKSLLEGLKEAGIYIKSSCGGCASCSDCIVKVREGEDLLTPPKFEETRLLGNVYHITKERLACQTYLKGNVTVDISSHDEKNDQVKIANKTSKLFAGKTMKRSKEEVAAIAADRTQQRNEREISKGPQLKSWEKTDELTDQQSLPKKQGGWKRPKQFKTDDEEEGSEE